jgi:hypothetical protein
LQVDRILLLGAEDVPGLKEPFAASVRLGVPVSAVPRSALWNRERHRLEEARPVSGQHEDSSLFFL